MNTEYEQFLQYILDNGSEKTDRTGTGTLSTFGYQMRFNLQEGFPLITTKKVHTKSIIGELLWFLDGDTNVKNLQKDNIRIWNEWRRPYKTPRKIVKIKQKPHEDTPIRKEVKNNNESIDINSLSSIDKKLYEEWCNLSLLYRFTTGTLKLSEEWKDFSIFAQDVKKLPHWYYKLNNWDNFFLDVSYYRANEYNSENCIWLHEDEYYEYSNNDPIVVTDNVGNSTVHVSRNSYNNVNDYEIKSLPTFDEETGEEILYRYELIEDGDLGDIYSAQWRRWETSDGKFIDQIENVIQTLKKDPNSRRIIVNAWNVGALDNMALMPCHALFQFYVENGKLSCQLYQRSADSFLGVPFNIASYSLLTHMIAQQVGLDVGEFIWTGGDCHIYKDHIETVKTQVSREPYEFPTLKLRKAKDIYSYTYDDVIIENYQHHPILKGKVSV